MANWSRIDKQRLLLALRKHGSNNLFLIGESLPDKRHDEIRVAISYYKRQAENKWANDIFGDEAGDMPIHIWIGILKKINWQHRNLVQNIVPRVLKYIYLYESRTGRGLVDLGDCYKVLSDIMNGNSSKDLDSETATFLRGCLKQLAESLQYQDLVPIKNYLKGIESFEWIINKKNANSLNPLLIPDFFLEMKKND